MAALPDRPIPRTFLARHALAIGVGALLVCSVLPASWLGWAGWFRSLVDTAVTPVAHPARLTSGVFAPEHRDPEPEQIRLLTEELARERLARLQAEQRTLRLLVQLEQLSRGAAINPEVPVVQRPAVVAGASGGLMLVRAGRAQGVERGAVATVGGVQLLGAVEDADFRTCRVRPITDRSIPTIRAAVMLDESASATLDCLLTPVGDGTLRGDAESLPDGAPRELAPGMTVRLRDDRWPEHAQMLVIGTVERVEPHEQSPLRRVVTVRPTRTLTSAREVVFRIPEGPGEGGP